MTHLSELDPHHHGRSGFQPLHLIMTHDGFIWRSQYTVMLLRARLHRQRARPTQ